MSVMDVVRMRLADVDAYAQRFLSSDPAVLRTIPPGATTSIAWQWWHLTRTEDVGVNLLVMDRPQAFDTGGWGERLGVPQRDIGAGMTPDEVARITEAVVLEELRAYRAEVSAATRDAVERLEDEPTDTLPEARIADILRTEGAVPPDLVDRLARGFATRSRAWLLSHFGLVHAFEHIGQSRMLRAMIRRAAASTVHPPAVPPAPESTAPPAPAAWLRGPVEGVPPLLQPVAHALQHAREDADAVARELPDRLLWARPGGVASPGFHLRHAAGVVDRLFTYARGEALTREQLEALAVEGEGAPTTTTRELADAFGRVVERATEQLRATDEGTLTEPRLVGRRGLPSTVVGMLFHAAEDAQRHVGQLLVTVRVQRSLDT